MWIDAFNSRDIDRIYDLAPDEIKQHVTLAQFKEENIDNYVPSTRQQFYRISTAR